MKESVVIYPAPGGDPATRSHVFQHDGRKVTLLGIAEEEKAADSAASLVAEGARLVELCGGFGPVLAAPVIDRVRNRAPVGAVGYGTESLELISRFHLRFLDGEIQSEAFAILIPGIDPAANRLTVEHGDGAQLTVQAVPDIEEAERFAVEQADRGTGLLELFGGFRTGDVACIFDAANGRIPIGIALFGIESIDAAAEFYS